MTARFWTNLHQVNDMTKKRAVISFTW
jgi:hypothetical protein